MSPQDAVTLATVSAALLLVSAAAAGFPAWRAAHGDPASVLRGEV